jgi:hypothetical protein
MGEGNKNVEDPCTWGRDIRKTKFYLLDFFLTPFNTINAIGHEYKYKAINKLCNSQLDTITTIMIILKICRMWE